ncbi:hypothetical protein PC123_g23473 [Phytophthora cactorum]|nr:hypothetical protein PC123_g23473 [Phytophthora cactorum]
MKRRFLQDLMTRNIGFCNTSFLFLVELTLLNWGKLRTRPLKRTLSGIAQVERASSVPLLVAHHDQLCCCVNHVQMNDPGYRKQHVWLERVVATSGASPYNCMPMTASKSTEEKRSVIERLSSKC